MFCLYFECYLKYKILNKFEWNKYKILFRCFYNKLIISGLKNLFVIVRIFNYSVYILNKCKYKFKYRFFFI